MASRSGVTVPSDKQAQFTILDLLKQAKADLWAKEVQTGYTVTYAWMANQLGHFALGFIPVYFLLWLALASGLAEWLRPILGEQGLRWSQFLIPAAWLLWFINKERGDVQEAIADARKDNVFPMDAGDVRRDAYTAVYFFAAGLAVACADLAARLHKDPAWYWLPVVVFLAQFLVGLFPAYYWLSRKKCFQQADLPYIFRLANFPPKISSPPVSESVPALLEFTSMQGKWKHLLICGPLQSGKTTLASAIGTEHTFRMGRARYLGVFDFLQFADFDHDPLASPNQPLWPWQQSNILILDDLDPGFPDDNILSRAEIVKQISKMKSLNQLRSCRTVWLVGNEAHLEFWRTELARLLQTKPEEIGLVHLTSEALQVKQAAAMGLA